MGHGSINLATCSDLFKLLYPLDLVKEFIHFFQNLQLLWDVDFQVSSNHFLDLIDICSSDPFLLLILLI